MYALPLQYVQSHSKMSKGVNRDEGGEPRKSVPANAWAVRDIQQVRRMEYIHLLQLY
jgi:hypothetical protein